MIVVFARAPVPGRVKTRLVPRLGPWRAASLHVALTHYALRCAAAARCGPVELHLTARHSRFRSIPRVKLQRGADLGARMHHALAVSLRRSGAPVILIGADCPVLSPRELRRAARVLCGACDVVLAPAEDGGYGLIGVRKSSPLLFHGVDWGSAQVFTQTVRRLERLGWRWRALGTVWDVDRPQDLERLRALRFSSGDRRAARR